jgi:hypothetical protein
MVDLNILIYKNHESENNHVYDSSNSNVSRDKRVYSESWYKTFYENSLRL